MELKKRYDNLDLLKAIAILMVVAVHVPLFRFNFIADPSFSKIIQYGLRLGSEGVPIFVFVNGFLLLRKETIDVKKHYKKLGKMILLMIFWCAVTVLLLSCLRRDASVPGVKEFFELVLRTNISSRYTGHLWFLIDLIGLYVIYPLIWSVFKEHFYAFKIVLIAALVFSCGAQFFSLLETVSSVSIFGDAAGFIRRFNSFDDAYFVSFFCMGGMAYKYLDTVKKHRVLLTAGGLIALGCAFAYGYFTSIKNNELCDAGFCYGSVFMPFMVLGWFALTVNYENKVKPIEKIVSVLGKNTFGIYLLHPLIIALVERRYLPTGALGRVAEYFIVVLLSVVLAAILRKIKYVKKIFELG